MSDDNLRQAGSKGVTEVVMALIKESNPIKALFDKEYLKLSFKYFSCSTLKIRMAGLQQLNVCQMTVFTVNSATFAMAKSYDLISHTYVIV